ncbi:MAG: DUF177 domain-containing protein [Actinobacteria bacterium]|nr:MAG: DUF177 domain-containing protein [Actinomycetota bacterium]
MTVPIDVRDLLGHPGASRTVHVGEPVAGLATQVASVPEDRPVAGDLLFESVIEGLLVSGSLEGTMALVCARCLKPIESAFRIDVQELFAPGATPTDDEYPVTDGSVDLEPMIRDAVVLAMPFAPLCRPDCQGLCERCGGDRNLGECACPPETDSRWSALLELNFSDDVMGMARERRGEGRG